ncbi:MAG: S26 family signal peptidase [Anaerolineaceae bacterium]|nr:S26 family signal peptidase [Anaerolineaceae bacterium]
MLKFFKIKGESLYPEYRNGDYVLVAKSPFPYIRMKIGDVIAFHQAEYGLMIKRISEISEAADIIEVKGSVIESIDSRSFGPVRRKDVIGKVIWHIAQLKSS